MTRYQKLLTFVKQCAALDMQSTMELGRLTCLAQDLLTRSKRKKVIQEQLMQEVNIPRLALKIKNVVERQRQHSTWIKPR